MICASGKTINKTSSCFASNNHYKRFKHNFYVIRCETINLAFKNTVDFARKMFDVLAPSHE